MLLLSEIEHSIEVWRKDLLELSICQSDVFWMASSILVLPLFQNLPNPLRSWPIFIRDFSVLKRFSRDRHDVFTWPIPNRAKSYMIKTANWFAYLVMYEKDACNSGCVEGPGNSLPKTNNRQVNSAVTWCYITASFFTMATWRDTSVCFQVETARSRVQT